MKGLRTFLPGIVALAAFAIGLCSAELAHAQRCNVPQASASSASSAVDLQNQALVNQLLQLQLQRQNASTSTSASASSAAPRLTTLQVAPLAVPAPASSSAAASSAVPAIDPLLLTASTVPVTNVCNGACGPRLRALTFRPRSRSVSRSVSISRTR